PASTRNQIGIVIEGNAGMLRPSCLSQEIRADPPLYFTGCKFGRVVASQKSKGSRKGHPEHSVFHVIGCIRSRLLAQAQQRVSGLRTGPTTISSRCNRPGWRSTIL